MQKAKTPRRYFSAHKYTFNPPYQTNQTDRIISIGSKRKDQIPSSHIGHNYNTRDRNRGTFSSSPFKQYSDFPNEITKISRPFRHRYKTKWHPLIVLKGSANTYGGRSNVRNTHEQTPLATYSIPLSPSIPFHLIGISPFAYPRVAGQLLLVVHPLLQHYDLPWHHVHNAYAYMQTSRAHFRSSTPCFECTRIC